MVRPAGRRTLPLWTSHGEKVFLPRDELFEGLSGPAGDVLDRGSHPVKPVLPVQPGDGEQMLIDVWPESGACEHLLGPRLRRDVDVGNRPAQRARVLFGNTIHVLRSGTGQLQYPADIRPRPGQDSSDDPRDVASRDR